VLHLVVQLHSIENKMTRKAWGFTGSGPDRHNVEGDILDVNRPIALGGGLHFLIFKEETPRMTDDKVLGNRFPFRLRVCLLMSLKDHALAVNVDAVDIFFLARFRGYTTCGSNRLIRGLPKSRIPRGQQFKNSLKKRSCIPRV
jgi:hypothetical protein